eukprot:1161817-Pelagomonas_calceolata.AAC.5
MGMRHFRSTTESCCQQRSGDSRTPAAAGNMVARRHPVTCSSWSHNCQETAGHLQQFGITMAARPSDHLQQQEIYWPGECRAPAAAGVTMPRRLQGTCGSILYHPRRLQGACGSVLYHLPGQASCPHGQEWPGDVREQRCGSKHRV